MPKRIVQHRRLRKQPIGDMRERISLEERSITAPSFSSASFTEEYTVTAVVWAKIETDFNGRIFDDVSIDDAPSHKFSIRYRNDVTTETRIRYKDVLYRILKTDNLEMRDEYLVLYATIDGADDKEASQ